MPITAFKISYKSLSTIIASLIMVSMTCLLMLKDNFQYISITFFYTIFLILVTYLIYRFYRDRQFITNKILHFKHEIVILFFFQLVNSISVFYFSNAKINILFYLVSILFYLYAVACIVLQPGVSAEKSNSISLDLDLQKSTENKINMDLILSAIDSATDDLIIILSNKYDIIYLNKAKEDFLFLVHSQKIGIGENIKIVLNSPSLSFLLKPLDQIFVDKIPIQFEHELVTTIDGHKEWVSIRIIPNYNRDIFYGVTIYFQNISYSKALEQNNAKQISKLYNIAWRHSHLMRAPLANILGLVHEIVKSDIWESKNEQVKILIEYLEIESKKLDKIISENVISTNN